MDHEAMGAVAEGFRRLTAGQATLPPIVRVEVPENHGEVDIKTAYIHGLESFAIKIASGFFQNKQLGLPTGSGMMVVVSTRTGFPEAVLLDNGYLTDLRTGLAGAIAAEFLAPREIETAGVIGAGTQARYQIRGLKLVRDFQRLLVYSIDPEEMEGYAREMSEELGVGVDPAESPEQVVRASQFVVTATPAREPLVQADWAHPGLHITSMGSDSEDKQELEAKIFSRASKIVCDQREQAFRLGELHHALEASVLSDKDEILELGALISGHHPGRQDQDEFTICDLTGVGVQDTQIALLVYRRAQERNLGLQLPT